MNNVEKQPITDSAIRRAGQLANYIDDINIATDLLDWCDKQRPQTRHGRDRIRHIRRFALNINNSA